MLDALRPPSLLETGADAYKDWLHLNVLDHDGKGIGLVNVSLHGAPDDPRARAIGTALWNTPAGSWLGGVEVAGIQEAKIGRSSIALESVALAVDHAEAGILASVRMPKSDLVL